MNGRVASGDLALILVALELPPLGAGKSEAGRFIFFALAAVRGSSASAS